MRSHRHTDTCRLEVEGRPTAYDYLRAKVFREILRKSGISLAEKDRLWRIAVKGQLELAYSELKKLVSVRE